MSVIQGYKANTTSDRASKYGKLKQQIHREVPHAATLNNPVDQQGKCMEQRIRCRHTAYPCRSSTDVLEHVGNISCRGREESKSGNGPRG